MNGLYAHTIPDPLEIWLASKLQRLGIDLLNMNIDSRFREICYIVKLTTMTECERNGIEA